MLALELRVYYLHAARESIVSVSYRQVSKYKIFSIGKVSKYFFTNVELYRNTFFETWTQ